MKSKITVKMLGLLVAVSMITGLVGCNDHNNSVNNNEDKSLVISLEGGDWGYPSPFCHYSRGPGNYKMALIFDSLLERGEKEYIPWLADKWEISEDGLTYTFTLREDVDWHDGTPMTAQDVKFSFEYFEKHPPVLNDLTVDGESFINSIEVVDAKTAIFTVEKPMAIILGKLGNTRIIPKHIWENINDPQKFTTPEAVIGTGPYILKEYSKEQGAYRFEAFKDFWGPEQKVDTLQFVPVSDSLLAFDKGEIDLVAVTPDILSRYEGNSDYKVMINPAFWGYRLIFNMEKSTEFKEKETRQALAYAIDKNELVEKVARKAAVPASAGYLPVNHVWYNNSVKNYEYNIDKAKNLLNGTKMSFNLLVGNDNNEIRIAELIKINLEKVGIEISVKSVDSKSRDGALKNADYEIVLTGHGGWGNDADLIRPMYLNQKTPSRSLLVGGIPGYSNEEINELCTEQLYEMDQIKRKEMIFELQELIAQEVPQIPLYNTTGYIVFRPQKYDGWKYMFDHHEVTHNKLSYLDVKE